MKPETIRRVWAASEKMAGRCDIMELLAEIGDKRDFKFDEILGMWGEYTNKVKDGFLPELISLYVHIPFCIKKCAYCIYYSYAPKDSGEIDAYLDYLDELCENYSQFFKGLKLRTLFIGGGTPTLPPDAQMERMLNSIFSKFEFDFLGEMCCETNPMTATENKIRMLRQRGFNRVSMGVQTFSRKALKLCGRDYQDKARVLEMIEMINSFDFERGLNIDLIAGLNGDTADSFIETFSQVAALKPRHITVQPLYKNSNYNQRYMNEYSNSESGCASGSDDIHARVRSDLARIAVENDYACDSLSQTGVWTFNEQSRLREQPMAKRFDAKDISACPENAPASCGQYRFPMEDDSFETQMIRKRVDDQFGYDDLNLHPFSLLSIGPTSRSHIFSFSDYKSSETKNFYIDRESDIYPGMKYGMGYEMTRFVLLSLRREHLISRDHFKMEFGLEIENVFEDQIKALQETGKLEQDKSLYRVATEEEKDVLFCAFVFATKKMNKA